MVGKHTSHILDFIDDYEQAAEDYATFGPLWAEMVFPDDFEALKAIYGGKSDSTSRKIDVNDNHGTAYVTVK